jgi:transposase InsO family protein
MSRSKTYKAKKRREYRVPGPNWLWAIDGHAKLIHAGIEIYGAINTYSRCIVWVFVGLSACTQVSVVQQFLQVVRSRNLFPKRLRSDRGSETAMIADAQYYLSKEDKRISEGLTEVEAAILPLKDCYIFGTSTSNVRIESWWNQLQRKCLIPWRVSRPSKSFPVPCVG